MEEDDKTQTLSEILRTMIVELRAEQQEYEARVAPETLPERMEYARRVRWWGAYQAALNARHLAGDTVDAAHLVACQAAERAAGPMPAEFVVTP